MNFDSGITMTYKVKEVLETLHKNLEEHLVIYNEALEGFREEGMATLSKQLEELKANNLRRIDAGKDPAPISIHINAPVSHESDYDAVISMLEHCVEETVTFNQQQYCMYMMDRWDWQKSFLTTVSGYSSTANAKFFAGNF